MITEVKEKEDFSLLHYIEMHNCINKCKITSLGASVKKSRPHKQNEAIEKEKMRSCTHF